MPKINTPLRRLLPALGLLIAVAGTHQLWTRSASAPEAEKSAEESAGNSAEKYGVQAVDAAPAAPVASPTPSPSHHDGDYQKLGWKDLSALDSATGTMPAALKKALAGPVMIPGFIVPLIDDAGETLDTFLLVPEPMMCVHVPAPPPEYIVQVTMRVPTAYPPDFHPYSAYWVRGRLKVSKVESELAEAAYEMSADDMLPFQGETEQAEAEAAEPDAIAP
jgi:hypothetical protein